MMPKSIPTTFEEWLCLIYGEQRSGYVELRVLGEDHYPRRQFVPLTFDDGQFDGWNPGETAEGSNVYFGVLPRGEKGKGNASNLLPSPVLYIDIAQHLTLQVEWRPGRSAA